jgi:hypothetical protein
MDAKSVKRSISEFMEEKGINGIARKTVTKLQMTEFTNEAGEVTGKQLQVSLDGTASFRVREGSKDWSLFISGRIRPGMIVTFSYGSVTTSKGSEDYSTQSGGEARVPLTFTNYFDTEVLFVQAGVESEAEFDKEVKPVEGYVIPSVKRESTFKPRGKMEVPKLKEDDLAEETASASDSAFD